MELKDFISETIYEIATGVKNSMEKCKDLDVIVNPDVCGLDKEHFYIPQFPNKYATNRRIEPIEIDVSVVVSKSEESSIGGKIGISTLGIGGKSNNSDDTKNTNRIKFTVPVALPVTKMLTKDKTSE